MKVVILCGGQGTRLARGDRVQAQADGRDRRPADPLAHHEALRALRLQRVRPRLGYKGETIKRLLPRLRACTSGLHGRRSAPASSRVRHDGRRVEDWTRHLRRHRRRHDDRRAHQARRRAPRRRRRFMLTYGDGVADVDLTALLDVPPRRTAGSPRSPACARRRASASWSLDGDRGRVASPRSRSSATAGSTAASSSSSRGVPRLPRPTTRTASSSASRCERLAADGQLRRLPPRRLLAVHGQRAGREDSPRRTRGTSGAAPWKAWPLIRDAFPAASASSSPATPASRARGSRTGSRCLGAEVVGYALEPLRRSRQLRRARGTRTLPGRFRHRGRARPGAAAATVADAAPQVVFHLAAQPLVRYSYEHPAETFEVNTMGAANVLDAVRAAGSVGATVVITSDKAYRNVEQEAGYAEDDTLGGTTPTARRKRARSMSSTATGLRTWRRGAVRSRPPVPATSSAAATGPRIASSPTPCAPSRAETP